ncbi:MAG TPA: lysophospholipid acyltransferase family protein [Terriglobales bacterium]|nr:lysophospholipid acyltransferase family protein [Terriglobales bacterium]
MSTTPSNQSKSAEPAAEARPGVPAQSTAKPERISYLLSRLRSYFILNPLIFLYTAVLGAISLVASAFEKGGRMQHNLAVLWSKLILKTSMSPVKVYGAEKVDFQKAHLFAANHISAMDVPVLYTQLPCQFRIVANKGLFNRPFIGWHLKRSGQIPIDRSSPRATFKSLHNAVEDLKKGLSVSIFPEGGRSETGKIKPFMNGGFYVAVKAQTPVVPVAIVGTYQMLPMNTFHIKPTKLAIHFGEPIPTAGMTSHDLDTLSERVKKAVEAMYYAQS